MEAIYNLIPYIKSLSGDRDTPITLYEKFVGDSIGFLLESKDPQKGRYSFIGKCPSAMIEGRGEQLTITEGLNQKSLVGKSLTLIKEYMSCYKVQNNSTIPFIGGAVGMLGYDIVKQYEKIPILNSDNLELPDIHLMVVKEVIVYDHFHSRIHLVSLEDDTEEGNKRGNAALDRMELQLNNNTQEKVQPNAILNNYEEFKDLNEHKEEFIEKVNIAKKYIKEGDIFQVVLSQRWCVSTKKPPFALYRQLREINPSPYLFYINYGDYQLTGSSPEMLVEVRGNSVYTCPIAGTRIRGKNQLEDVQLEGELLSDPKEQAEHVMLVDLARNDMGRISKIGTVKVQDFMKIHRYSHVMHIVSTVEGIKREDEDCFSILSHFIPAGTLSGAPKIRAMEIIEELENEKRGPYGGAVGYFGFDGDMDMCITIRTMTIKDGKVYLQAGAGIVADSIPENEFDECKNKIKSLIKAIKAC